MVDFYDKHGWVHIKNQIPGKTISIIRDKGIKLRLWVDDKIGQPSDKGLNVHWKGVGAAGMYDEYLLDFYKSDIMYEIASKLLKTPDVWMFNDQMVVKLPDDDLHFTRHTDNIYPRLNTVNLCVILDDFTDENGALEIFNVDDDKLNRLYPNKGDIVAIQGNTWHQSGLNKTNETRGLYACVYCDEMIDHHNYHKTKVRN